eukprot:Lankesteria_metandrocarpae@DN3837_c0_g1_i1.p1
MLRRIIKFSALTCILAAIAHLALSTNTASATAGSSGPACGSATPGSGDSKGVDGHSSSVQTNNWAVIINTSRYWYNYRHSANALTFYSVAKRLGIPDERIVLMLSEDFACNPRNAMPGTEYNSGDNSRVNLYNTDIEVDFRGDDVSVETFIRVLTGRQASSTPRSKRLLTDEHSNIFIYMTGHGGFEFLKFQDWEVLSSKDLADAFEQMALQRRYRRIMFVTDTCQAGTLANQFRSPEVTSIGCSRKDENSLSHHGDRFIGVNVIDRFTHHAYQFLDKVEPYSEKTFEDLLKTLIYDKTGSNYDLRTDLSTVPVNSTKIVDFLGSSGTRTLQFMNTPFAIRSSLG